VTVSTPARRAWQLGAVTEPPSTITVRTPARSAPAIIDWQAEEDGPLTVLDIEVALAALEARDDQPTRDAARKLRRYFAGVLR
jgi:hypothetical protein